MNCLRQFLGRLLILNNALEYTNKSLTLAKIFGVFPLDSGLKFSPFYLCWTPLVFSAATFSLLYSFYFLYDGLHYTWKLTRFIDLSEITLTYLNSVVCFAFLFFFRKDYVRVVDRLHSSERRIACLALPFKYNLASSLWQTFSRLFYIIAKSSEHFLLHGSKKSIQYFVYTASLDLFYFLSHLTMCPFYVATALVGRQLTILNEKLQELEMTLDQSGRRKMERLIGIHMDLYDTCRLLNTIYSYIVFTLLGSAFILIIKNIYFVCYVLIAITESKNQNFYILTSLNFALLWFVEMYSITYTCVQVNRKSEFFNNELYKLILNDKHDFLGRSRILQIQLGYKSIIEFKVCGFLPLDYSTIHSIVASALTYIVLLLQFGSDSSIQSISK